MKGVVDFRQPAPKLGIEPRRLIGPEPSKSTNPGLVAAGQAARDLGRAPGSPWRLTYRVPHLQQPRELEFLFQCSVPAP